MGRHANNGFPPSTAPLRPGKIIRPALCPGRVRPSHQTLFINPYRSCSKGRPQGDPGTCIAFLAGSLPTPCRPPAEGPMMPGPSWRRPGPSLTILGPSWAIMEPSWGRVGASLGNLGPSWPPWVSLGPTAANSGPTLLHPTTSWHRPNPSDPPKT